MKRFVLAIALACALSGTALAGDAHSVGAPTPQASSCGSDRDTYDAKSRSSLGRYLG